MQRKPLRILLVEDSPSDAALMTLALERSKTPLTIECVYRLSDAIERLSQDRFHAVLADLSLPDSETRETVSRLRRHEPNVPIVVLTGLEDDDVALASLDQGAQDYLVKDHITPETLLRSIRYAMQRQRNAEMRRLLDKVRASERLLEKKNRRLAELYKTAHRFVDNVSHEFRTPLTVITEYASLLRGGYTGQLDPEQCRMVDIIGDRADDLNTMVDDMLDVSKLEAGMLGVCRARCQVAEIVNHVRLSLERKAAIRKTRFSIEVDEGLPDVFCDAEKVGRVLVNLAINAIKFCGEAGTVRLWAWHQHGDSEVTVGITDTGPGIERDQLEIIFNRFKQLDVPSRCSTKGFGLGLSIAKELVDLNLGQMAVESEPGHGSTFLFTIPLAEPASVLPRYFRRLRQVPGDCSTVSLVMASIDSTSSEELADDVDAFLNYLLRQHDFLLRAGTHDWLLLLPIDQEEFGHFTKRLQDMHQQTNRNRPRGPLPDVKLRVEGTYDVSIGHELIVARVQSIFEPLQAIHA